MVLGYKVWAKWNIKNIQLYIYTDIFIFWTTRSIYLLLHFPGECLRLVSLFLLGSGKYGGRPRMGQELEW